MVLSFVDPGECMSVDVSPVSYSDSDSDPQSGAIFNLGLIICII